MSLKIKIIPMYKKQSKKKLYVLSKHKRAQSDTVSILYTSLNNQ